MTGQEKETLSRLMASLFFSPDQEMTRQIHEGGLPFLFPEICSGLGEDTDLLKGFLMEGDLEFF